VPPENALERRYALRAVKQRLHQASFREAVIAAYNGRCALSGLPEPLLLDAAHIVSDRDERLGQPVVPNGIPLSKIHHAAFDAHLIGPTRGLIRSYYQIPNSWRREMDSNQRYALPYCLRVRGSKWLSSAIIGTPGGYLTSAKKRHVPSEAVPPLSAHGCARRGGSQVRIPSAPPGSPRVLS
jgi:hypothetical protein